MVTGISGIDHTLVGVRDLEGARRDYERLGFTLTPRGSHIGWGTANYCVMFPDDYIELIGIVDAGQFTNNLDEFLSLREGLMGLAFGTQDATRAAEALRARGVAAEGPQPLERRLELPEGTVLPRFSLVRLPGEAVPGLSAFICHHLTPALVRRPEWLDHPNGALGLVSLTVVVERPPALTEAYERLLGYGTVTPTDELISVRVGRYTILFVGADELGVLQPTAKPLDGIAPPYLAAMTLRVASLARAGELLTARGVPFSAERDGTIVVPPEAARGLWLVFTA